MSGLTYVRLVTMILRVYALYFGNKYILGFLLCVLAAQIVICGWAVHFKFGISRPVAVVRDGLAVICNPLHSLANPFGAPGLSSLRDIVYGKIYRQHLAERRARMARGLHW